MRQDKCGVTSVIHKGLSGFALEKKGDQVIKWTQGKESSKLLFDSAYLQAEERIKKELSPIKAVPIYAKSIKGDYFSFNMPFMDLPSGFTFKKNGRIIKSIIRQSFENRSWNPRGGFKSIIKKELLKYPLSDLKIMTEAALNYCSDIYPHGYAHGDMGFANMLIGEDEVYMIDFTPSFINSPLIDLCTMELSLFSEFTKSWNLECYTDCSNALFRYKEQAEVVRMVKVLSFMRDDDSSERRKELARMFYGWSGRKRNI